MLYLKCPFKWFYNINIKWKVLKFPMDSSNFLKVLAGQQSVTEAGKVEMQNTLELVDWLLS